MTWGTEELGVTGLKFSERCDWKGILFTVISEMPGICFLREMRRQVTRRKKYYYYLSCLYHQRRVCQDEQQIALHCGILENQRVEGPNFWIDQVS